MTERLEQQEYGIRVRLAILFIMVAGISLLHLVFSHEFEKTHIVARELYFLPIIISAFWFGLRGSLTTSLAITLFYLAYAIFYWRGFSAADLDRLVEIGLFNVVAVIVGSLQDRQRAHAREKLESIRALAATVGHEINSPLFVAMGNVELLQDDFAEDSETYKELGDIRASLKEIKNLVKKIASIEEVVTRDYDGTSRIVDLEES